MIIRKYKPSDCEYLIDLFYNTVHTVNAKDYSEEQLNVWATKNVDLAKWNKSLSEHYSVVAVEDDVIVGFGDIDETGYLDRLYVHKDYQNRGIATAICNELEQAFEVCEIVTHASITAKTFFIHRGYNVMKEQQVIRDGISLTNYVMEKRIV
ncbi:GNAT family N-acetyltransferase [Anaerosporobacter sp.]|uniref:GNAT family N-acetyltransferase n=1 Tax=Anaerosporobacter sp. TaxID=1872529 RepID=UPI00286F7763|nr:GNAT family N-acetyltransferase [Anaerosporobacter sp.]